MSEPIASTLLAPPQAPVASPETAAATPTAPPLISYRTALWIARSGRIAVHWLPAYVVCVAQFSNPTRALYVSILFAATWKLALRRAYTDGQKTVWAVGANVESAFGAVTGALAVLAIIALVPAFRISGLGLIELTVTMWLASAVWESVVSRSLAARRRVLIVGTTEGAASILADIETAPELPFHVVGVVDEENEPDQIAGVPVYGAGADLRRIVEWERPQIVVLAGGGTRATELEALVDVGHLGFGTVGLAEFYEYAFGKLPVRSLTPDWFLSILTLYRRSYSKVSKRTFDVVVSAFALVLVAPLLPLIALLVRRTPGPVIYRQRRLGEGGKPFTVYKFRTMRFDAEAAGMAMWAIEHDPRVTSVGRFLRKTRLDELPQLWNVVRGEMSMVGPRPERPEFMEELQAEVPFWGRRHLVKPGITGWAQIRRGYTADAAATSEKLSYDLWYLRHRSLALDVAICAKTVAVLFTGSGAR